MKTHASVDSRVFSVILLACVCTAASAVEEKRGEAKLRFEIRLPKEAVKAPVTGRLFVFLSQREGREPRFGPNWFGPEPFFGLDVAEFSAGETRTIDEAADGFPTRLSKLKPGRYRIQALLDHDFYHAHHAHGVGNLYSEVREAELDPAASGVIELVLTKKQPERPFPETKHTKEIAYESELLSKFHKRKVVDRCGVVLPESYFEQPERRYPAVYVIPGFGGHHRMAANYARPYAPRAEGEVEFIVVMLSGQSKWGHHVYADSASNGPRGEALVQELIPRIDKKFRTIAEPTARFVTGHSSGGWSSLWLQVTYPDTFGGVWSTAPDPVDFRDYQQVNLYADPPLSLYYDQNGERRPIARRGSKPVLWYDSFGRMDDVLARGGQLRSFEAVFSPLDKNGEPAKLWDRTTGRIDPKIANAWRKYDIRLKLQNNWKTLGPKLSGKIQIVMGGQDTFYLDGAVRRLKETLTELGSDAEIEIHEDKDHGSVMTQQVRSKIRKQMSAKFLENHPR